METSPTFGDIVELIAADAPDLRAGDVGEVVGLSDDGAYVGLWIDRLQTVYTVATHQVKRVRAKADIDDRTAPIASSSPTRN